MGRQASVARGTCTATPTRLAEPATRESGAPTGSDLPRIRSILRAAPDRRRKGATTARQDVLREVTGRGIDAGDGGEETRIDTTLAGRVFRKGLGGALADGRGRHWIPVVDGTERLGVLRVDTTAAGAPDGEAMRDLASLLGLLLVSKRGYSDSCARPDPHPADEPLRRDAVDPHATPDVLRRQGEARRRDGTGLRDGR